MFTLPAISQRFDPSLVGYVEEGGSGNAVVTKPTGVVDGDLMIVVLASAGTKSFTAPAGWTALASGYMFYRVANAEGASYTFLEVGTGGQRSAILAFRGVTFGASGVKGAGLYPLTVGSIPAQAGKGFFLGLFTRVDPSVTISPPTGMRPLLQYKSTPYSYGVFLKRAVEGGETTGYTAVSSSAGAGVGVMVYLTVP